MTANEKAAPPATDLGTASTKPLIENTPCVADVQPAVRCQVCFALMEETTEITIHFSLEKRGSIKACKRCQKLVQNRRFAVADVQSVAMCQLCHTSTKTKVALVLPYLPEKSGPIETCSRCKEKVRELRLTTAKSEGIDLEQRLAEEAEGYTIPRPIMESMIDARLMTTFFGPGKSGKEET